MLAVGMLQWTELGCRHSGEASRCVLLVLVVVVAAAAAVVVVAVEQQGIGRLLNHGPFV